MLNSDYLPKDSECIGQKQLSLMNNLPVQELIEVIRNITDPGDRRWIRHKIGLY